MPPHPKLKNQKLGLQHFFLFSKFLPRMLNSAIRPPKTSPPAPLSNFYLCFSIGLQKLAGASLLIFANKQDITGALRPEQIAKVLQLDLMDGSRHWKIVGCSAVGGDGLLTGFDWIVSDIGTRIFMHE